MRLSLSHKAILQEMQDSGELKIRVEGEFPTTRLYVSTCSTDEETYTPHNESGLYSWLFDEGTDEGITEDLADEFGIRDPDVVSEFLLRSYNEALQKSVEAFSVRVRACTPYAIADDSGDRDNLVLLEFCERTAVLQYTLPFATTAEELAKCDEFYVRRLGLATSTVFETDTQQQLTRCADLLWNS